jgi:hypothetical protein
MKSVFKTFLVVVICLVSLSNSVQAQTTFLVPPGGIAIIGFNATDPDEFAFVCLTEIPDGTQIRFTDKGWTENNKFYEYESTFSWFTPGGCEVGQIVNIDLSDSENLSNISGDQPYDLTTVKGDQIIVYQQIGLDLNFIFAINFRLYNWQTVGDDKFSSLRPPGLDETNSLAIYEIDNSIHTGGPDNTSPATIFDSPSDALASIVVKENWKGSDTNRQTMPTGFFSFETTAVRLSEFDAKTGGITPPLWVIPGLVIVPIAILFFKRPKRDCCS